MGLVASSYVLTLDIQELQALTRTRSKIVSEVTQHKNRIHKVLQQANIKLTGFLSDIYAKTGRKLIDLLLCGEKLTEKSVTKCLHAKVRVSPQDILLALDGTLSKVHRLSRNADS